MANIHTDQAPNLQMAAEELWRTVGKALFDPYHPERHYMRGPGPKWRERHAQKTAAPEVKGLYPAV
ncbi:MAG TPA: hypothetical protein VHN11_17530 [Xanthobacteraceae bacterium]|jgi:hypothetical protein|nr:hypothetical protein [Xanthobacteraceae bacterium]